MKPGYKQTEVGVIPEDWDIRTLRTDLDQLEAGVSVNSVEAQSSSHDRSILKTSAVSNGRFIPSECKKIAPADISRARLTPRADTIIISRMNTPDLVGECGYVPDNFPNLFLPDRLWMTRFRSRSKVCVRWLAYLLCSESYNKKIKEAATGTSGSMKNIAKGSLLDLAIPFPRQEEQRAIAEALSDVDKLIDALDALIVKKRDLKQAAMQQLLTAHTRLPGFSGEWVAKSFGDVVAPRKERVDPRNNGPFDFCVELEHIASTTGSLLGHTIAGDGASIKSVFSSGDVLFGKLRAYLRKYWRADREGVCSTEIWVFRPKGGELLAEFLYHIVCTNEFVEAASNSYGTHMPRSDWNVVKELEIKLPPTKAEQTAIATVLSDMDAELAALEARREKTRALKQGMMQQLLTGQIRLV